MNTDISTKKIKIWINEIGEPLPLEDNVRMHRYGRFCRYLAEQGHDVTWWTSSFSHAPKKHFVEQDQDISIHGYTLRLIKGPGYPKNVSFQRIQHNKHFAKSWAQQAEKFTPPDLIINPIPVIEIADAAIHYAQKHQVPVLIDIRDEWPDELANIAPSPLRPLARLFLSSLYKKMNRVCSQANGVMGISQKQMNYGLSFAGRSQQDTDYVFPLGYPSPQLNPEQEKQAQEWLSKQFPTHHFKAVACFFGTIGRYFELEHVIQAAQQLPHIGFILAGDGDSFAKYKKMAAPYSNVFMPGWVDQPKIQAIMKASDIGLAPYVDNQAFSLPNKVFEYMSGGLAIISSIQQEFKELSEQHQLGRSYSPGQTQRLIEHLEELCNDKALLKQMQQNSFKLFNEQFEEQRVFKNAENFLLSLKTV